MVAKTLLGQVGVKGVWAKIQRTRRYLSVTDWRIRCNFALRSDVLVRAGGERHRRAAGSSAR